PPDHPDRGGVGAALQLVPELITNARLRHLAGVGEPEMPSRVLGDGAQSLGAWGDVGAGGGDDGLAQDGFYLGSARGPEQLQKGTLERSTALQEVVGPSFGW